VSDLTHTILSSWNRLGHIPLSAAVDVFRAAVPDVEFAPFDTVEVAIPVSRTPLFTLDPALAAMSRPAIERLTAKLVPYLFDGWPVLAVYVPEVHRVIVRAGTLPEKDGPALAALLALGYLQPITLTLPQRVYLNVCLAEGADRVRRGSVSLAERVPRP